MDTTFRQARINDAAAIADMVNRAYRPAGEGGWTHEARLVAGQRTSEEQVLELIASGSEILLMHSGGRIISCVNVRHSQGACELGMLATDPSFQEGGIGKKMLANAEAFACTKYPVRLFTISVLSSRIELLAFYERRGYVQTGESAPYPVDAGIGTPRELNVRVLFLKKITQAHFNKADGQ